MEKDKLNLIKISSYSLCCLLGFYCRYHFFNKVRHNSKIECHNIFALMFRSEFLLLFNQSRAEIKHGVKHQSTHSKMLAMMDITRLQARGAAHPLQNNPTRPHLREDQI